MIVGLNWRSKQYNLGSANRSRMTELLEESPSGEANRSQLKDCLHKKATNGVTPIL